MKRQLTDDERQTLKIHVDKLKVEVDDLRILSDYENWLVNRGGLWRNFKQQEKEHLIKLREIEKDIRGKIIGIQQTEMLLRPGYEIEEKEEEQKAEKS